MTIFVSRSEWGARPPRSISTNITPSSCTAHYGGGPVWNGRIGDHSVCADVMRSWQNFHMDDRGWSDIAYNMVACPHGYVFVGRGHGVRSAANGTNTGNQNSYAVCYLAGEGDPLTEDGKRAFLEAAQLLGQPLTKVHSDWFATSCPGDAVRAWVRAGAPAGTADIPQPTPTAGDDDMTPEQAQALTELVGLARSTNSAVGAIHVGVMDPTSGVRTMVAQLLGRQSEGADPVAVAKAVAASLPDDLARLVADELAERLKD